MPPNPYNRSGLGDYNPNAKLPQLPGTEKEAVEIAKILNAKPLIGKNATLKKVTSVMDDAPIIHLASHGIPSDFGQIALTEVALTDGESFLSAREIAERKLKAGLAVLSACETSGGFIIANEGVLGLARPFMMAGVPSVVVSLWQVPDDSTTDLMIEFYKNMQKEPDKAKALRLAILTTKSKYPNPYAWSPFVLFGNP